MVECRCGLVRNLGELPLHPLRAAHAAHGPCPVCGHHGANRVFWLEPLNATVSQLWFPIKESFT